MQPTSGGGYDAFVTKISPSGGHIVYSTYVGGTGDDTGRGIAVDSAGDGYIGGWVMSSTSVPAPGFPTTWNAIRKSYGGGLLDSFITKLDPNGKLLYSSLFGGNGNDAIYAVAVDQYRTMYVAGYTASTDFPQLASFRPPDPRSLQGFVATIVPSGISGKSIHYYSTTLGATLPSEPTGNIDYIMGIAVDSALNTYVGGTTSYPLFPVTAGAFSRAFRAEDAFISKLVIAADLGLAISASPVTAVQGNNLTYTLSVHNKLRRIDATCKFASFR